MTDLAPGANVRVVIDNATLIEHSTFVATIEYACHEGCTHRIALPKSLPSITITPRAQPPQVGDVWQMPDGIQRHILQAPDGVLHAVRPEDPEDLGEDDRVSDFDFTDAHRLYPPLPTSRPHHDSATPH